MPKFEVTFDVENDDDDANLTEEQFAESVESEAEEALMDLGYSNVEVKVL